jgi:hypothetical protein
MVARQMRPPALRTARPRPEPGNGALFFIAGIVVLLLAVGWVRRGTWEFAVPSLVLSVLLFLLAGANLHRALSRR